LVTSWSEFQGIFYKVIVTSNVLAVHLPGSKV